MLGEELELLSIGDVDMDVFLEPSESETLCRIDNRESLICFSFGDKIPVKTIHYSVGGNAANNAVGASRLGVKAGIVTTLGGDSTGRQIIEHLSEENVDLTFTIQQPAASSNFSTVINYSGERTIFTYKAPRSYEFPVKMPAAPWIYLTSMGDSFEPFYLHFIDWYKKHEGIKIAYNPGSRQIRADRKVLEPILKNSYMVYINRKEAEIITGMKGSETRERELLQQLAALGPKISIVTDGAEGSYVFDGKRFLHAGILPLDSFERTGAGDAFGSGCVAALIKGKPLEEAILWGTANSASVIGFIGAQKGLLKMEEMDIWMERARSSSVVVKEF